MKTMELKVARIGNSRGVRLPAKTLRRYGIEGAVLMEERPEGILLHPQTLPGAAKLSWEETAREMAKSQEEWREWDATAGDGLESIPWELKVPAVAEKQGIYRVKRRPTRAMKGSA